ncbi:CPBP family intramembrane metalloprotease [Pontibacter sp. FD36]|uniref:CPBP family intramembrane glutamic endopeptidase n=1 Tax=Pontibacter sp. FD36 TaxID=2789860 RepID=UPI0018A8ABB7|nr:CPBP family intramembrane glutamic endopeptidase [Pontibacter sp. FD36]MBF8962909.1 CPBP family intramembrane metalloprotease [Pontibacter sp. FD36]
MEKLYQYFESIPRSRTKTLVLVLAGILCITSLLNLLFLSDKLRDVLDNQLYFVGMVLVVYLSWLVFLHLIQKRDPVQPEHLSLRGRDIASGFAVAAFLYLAVTVALAIGALLGTDGLAVHAKFATIGATARTLGVFTFNIMLNAFVEELLFRVYLIPQAYLLLRQKIASRFVALLLAVLSTQLLFALIHLPRDLFRFDVALATMISTQAQLFMSGLLLTLVYLRTRNLLFLTMFHAFLNYGLPLVSTDSDFKLYYMIAAFAVTIFWSKIPGLVPVTKQQLHNHQLY